MLKNSLIVMLLTSISRILGLARTVIVAYYFGATEKTDAYFSSFKIANFFRQLLGEGALGTVFIPVYNEKNIIEGQENSKVLIFSVINFLFLFLSLLSLLTIIFSDVIIDVTVSGYNQETKILASKLLKIMSFYIFFIGLAGTISAVLNNFGKFVMPAFMPVMFNISIIFAAIFYHEKYGIAALAYGVLFGGVLELLVLLPQFIKVLKKYKIIIQFKDPYFKKVFILLVPMLFGIFAKQINVIVDQYFGSYLTNGSISALENATRIYNLPLGVFAISIATVFFPGLSKKVEMKNFEGAKVEIEKSINFLAFFIVPSIFILTFYAKDVVIFLLGYGEFAKAESIKMTTESLLFYSTGLFFYSAIHIVSRAFYVMKNTKLPVVFSVISIVLNIILNYLLVDKMKHSGLALATSISLMINFVLLYTVFNMKYFKINTKKMLLFIFKMTIVSLIALLISWFIKIIIVKLILFLVLYFAIWAKSLLKKKINFFC